MAVVWENTDQFGNMAIGASSASMLEDISADLASMVELVFSRLQVNVEFSIDVAYGEISAPNANQVTHVLQLPWMSQQADSKEEVFAKISVLLSEVLGDKLAKIVGPWDF
jgi:hypothetical protein